MKSLPKFAFAVALAAVVSAGPLRSAAATVSIEPLSRIPAGAPRARTANGDSVAPVFSSDGRFIAFLSDAADLTTNAIAQGPREIYVNVFVRDLELGTTELISVAADGRSGGRGNSANPLVSANGRYVVFESDAADLVSGDSNGARDLFVRDRVAGKTALVSAAAGGGAPGNGASNEAALTPNGRFVAFASAASDLVVDDTNGIPDVFVRDLVLGTTTLASPGAVAGANSYAASRSPSVSDDGTVVAFSSTASGLADGITDAAVNVFARDLTAGRTEWISRQPASEFAAGNYSFNPALSANGRFVAFKTAQNAAAAPTAYRWDRRDAVLHLVAKGLAMDLAGEPDGKGPLPSADGTRIAYFSGRQLYVWNADTDTAVLASVTAAGTTNAAEGCLSATMNRSGTHVVFVSAAPDLASGDTRGVAQAFVRDLDASTTRLASLGPADLALGRDVACPALSGDGTRIAFQSDDPAVVDSDGNAANDVFVRDLTAIVTRLVSGRDNRLPIATSNRRSQLDTVSADGRTVVFTSLAEDLAPNDSNGEPDVFAADLVNGVVELISVSAATGRSANGGSRGGVVSGSGRAVAFTSTATNLVVDATSGYGDVYVRDRDVQGTVLASANGAGTGGGDRPSTTAGISSDGRHVAFIGDSRNLVSATPVVGFGIFMRNLQTANTVRVGAVGSSAAYLTYAFSDKGVAFSATNGFGGARGLFYRAFDATTNESVAPLSFGPSTSLQLLDVSANGRGIAYSRPAAGLPGLSTLEIHDRLNATNHLLVPARDASLSYDELARPRLFSSNGRTLVFSDARMGLVPIDANGNADIFVADLDTGILRLASVNREGTASGNGISDQASIGADGRFVVFRSTATDLTDDSPGLGPQIYLRDLSTGSTVLVSRAPGGGGGNGGCSRPQLINDGPTVVFSSTADNLVAGDYNGARDLFVARVTLSEPGTPFDVDARLDGDNALYLTWPRSGASQWQVQYQRTLAEGWTTVDAVVARDGANATARIPLPAAAQGYYRVLATP